MSKIIHSQHIRPWITRTSDLVHVPREKLPQKRVKHSDPTEIEEEPLTRYNRPVTRLYSKMLEKADQARQDLKPVACIYDYNKQIPIRYLKNNPV